MSKSALGAALKLDLSDNTVRPASSLKRFVAPLTPPCDDDNCGASGSSSLVSLKAVQEFPHSSHHPPSTPKCNQRSSSLPSPPLTPPRNFKNLTEEKTPACLLPTPPATPKRSTRDVFPRFAPYHGYTSPSHHPLWSHPQVCKVYKSFDRGISEGVDENGTIVAINITSMDRRQEVSLHLHQGSRWSVFQPLEIDRDFGDMDVSGPWGAVQKSTLTSPSLPVKHTTTGIMWSTKSRKFLQRWEGSYLTRRGKTGASADHDEIAFEISDGRLVHLVYDKDLGWQIRDGPTVVTPLQPPISLRQPVLLLTVLPILITIFSELVHRRSNTAAARQRENQAAIHFLTHPSSVSAPSSLSHKFNAGVHFLRSSHLALSDIASLEVADDSTLPQWRRKLRACIRLANHEAGRLTPRQLEHVDVKSSTARPIPSCSTAAVTTTWALGFILPFTQLMSIQSAIHLLPFAIVTYLMCAAPFVAWQTYKIHRAASFYGDFTSSRVGKWSIGVPIVALVMFNLFVWFASPSLCSRVFEETAWLREVLIPDTYIRCFTLGGTWIVEEGRRTLWDFPTTDNVLSRMMSDFTQNVHESDGEEKADEVEEKVDSRVFKKQPLSCDCGDVCPGS